MKKVMRGSSKPRRKSTAANFTAQESLVFDLIVREGMSNPEIARSLRITERTAKFHAGNVLRKVGAPDRLKLTVSYWRALDA
jgi:DNA-binding NarL/FixJ family response regulator